MSNTAKTAAVQPQEVPTPKTVNRSTFILTMALTFFATLVVVTIANWFLYGSIHTDARAAVVNDIQLVSKTSQR